MEIDFVGLGAIIAHSRRAQRYQGEEVARAVGIHPVTLSRIEHGKLPGVTFAVLARLAWYLDLRLDSLAGNYPGKRFREAIELAKREYEESATKA
jgi:transcriptional regulator with XRE-family HTH domain